MSSNPYTADEQAYFDERYAYYTKRGFVKNLASTWAHDDVEDRFE
jgi:hypothetical protein